MQTDRLLIENIIKQSFTIHPRRVKDLFFSLFFTKPKNYLGDTGKFKKEHPEWSLMLKVIKELSREEAFFPGDVYKDGELQNATH